MIEENFNKETTFAGGFFFPFIEELAFAAHGDEFTALQEGSVIFDHIRSDHHGAAFDKPLSLESR